MNYNEELEIPSKCIMMNEDEMSYVEGGFSISQDRKYLNRVQCMAKANSIKKLMNWSGISTYDLAAEIFSHAYAYYNAGILIAVAGKCGIQKAAEYLVSLRVLRLRKADRRYWVAFNYMYANVGLFN